MVVGEVLVGTGVGLAAGAAGVPGAVVGIGAGAAMTGGATVAAAGMGTAGLIAAGAGAIGGTIVTAGKTNLAALQGTTQAGLAAAQGVFNVGQKAFNAGVEGMKRNYNTMTNIGDNIKKLHDNASERAQSTIKNATQRTEQAIQNSTDRKNQRAEQANDRRTQRTDASIERKNKRAEAAEQRKQSAFERIQQQKQQNAESALQRKAKKNENDIRRKNEAAERENKRKNDLSENRLKNYETRSDALRKQADTIAERAEASTQARENMKQNLADMRNRQAMNNATLMSNRLLSARKKINEIGITAKERVDKGLNFLGQKQLNTEATKDARRDKQQANLEAREQKFFDNITMSNAKTDGRRTRALANQAQSESKKQTDLIKSTGATRRNTLFKHHQTEQAAADITQEANIYSDEIYTNIDKDMAILRQSEALGDAQNEQVILQGIHQNEQRRSQEMYDHNLKMQGVENERDGTVHQLAVEENTVRTNMQEDVRDHESVLKTQDDKFKSDYDVNAELLNQRIQVQQQKGEYDIGKYKADTDTKIGKREAEAKEYITVNQEGIKSIKTETKDQVSALKKDLQRYTKEAKEDLKVLKAQTKYNIAETKGNADLARTTKHNMYQLDEEKKNLAHIKKLETLISQTDQLNHKTKLVNEKFKQEKAALNDQFEKSINSERAITEIERMEIQARHENAIDQLTIDHNNKMKEIYAQMEQLANEYNQTLSQLRDKMSPELQARLKDPAFRAKVTKLISTGAIKNPGVVSTVQGILQTYETAQNGQEVQRPEVILSDATKARNAKKAAQAEAPEAEAQKTAQIVSLDNALQGGRKTKEAQAEAEAQERQLA